MNKELWNVYLCIANKVESGGKGTDKSPIEGFIDYVNEFKKYCPPEKYKKVLNIGSGGGAESKLLVDAGYDVVSTTLGKDNVTYAKEEFNIETMEFDMHYLNFEPDSFDAIFMIQTQEHALAQWIFMLEMYFVLRDGGRVYTDLPSPKGGVMLRTIWHTCVLYPDQWRALFWKAGFKEVQDSSHPDRYRFIMEKLPKGKFEMWSYVQHIYKRRYDIYLKEGTRDPVWNKGAENVTEYKGLPEGSEPITYCQMSGNYEGSKKCLEQVMPYVDRAVFVVDKMTEEEMEDLRNVAPGRVHIYYHEWFDNFSEYRNLYINKLRELGPPYGWALVSDHDEVLSDEACRLLREYVDKSNNGLNYSVIKINSHDITYDWNGEKVQDNQSDWFKDLLFKVWSTTYYVGNPHEGLHTVVTGVIKFPKSAPYYHIKTFNHILYRGCENYWVGGGGDNMGENNPTWVEVKAICKKLGLDTWAKFWAYMKAGNVDQELKDWMIRYRNTNDRPWADSELRGYFIYYFYILHPEERPEGITTEFGHYVPMEKETGIVSRFEKDGDVSILGDKS